MIVSLVPETAWTDALTHLPEWQPPLRPTVVVAPHPDDETLGAAGLIATVRQAGCPVSVLAVTDGENCYAGEDLGQLRPAEQQAALARLGVSAENICRLRQPDSGLHLREDELFAAMLNNIPAGAHLVAPWPNDFHPDHEVCGRVAARVARERSLTLTYYFFWTWHRGTPALLAGMPLVRLPLSPGQLLAKREALFCHESQLEHSSGQPILPADLLEPAWRPFEVYLPA